MHYINSTYNYRQCSNFLFHIEILDLYRNNYNYNYYQNGCSLKCETHIATDDIKK